MKLVVLTGLSGSGKSSLAFDTIYAEGQRRYMESLSSYAKAVLGQMEKPNVESISGLPPAISIDQKSTNRNPRCTVGTVTEIYDYFRLLYARIESPLSEVRPGDQETDGEPDGGCHRGFAGTDTDPGAGASGAGTQRRACEAFLSRQRRAALSVLWWMEAFTSYPKRSSLIRTKNIILRLWSIVCPSVKILKNVYPIPWRRP